VSIASVAFAVGAFLAFSASAEVEKAESELEAAELQRRNLLSSAPAPSAENLAAAEANSAALSEQLASIRQDLERGARLSTSSDGIEVMAGIQQFISNFQRKVSAQTNEEGEPTPIAVPDNFAFGFERYRDEAQPPRDESRIPVLDKQRQILSYLLNQLIEARPENIESVERELVETSAAGPEAAGAGATEDGFQISTAVSARVPGAIDTMAFSLTFTGKTQTLRTFLNELAKFDLPIVVRSIEVERPGGSEAVTRPGGGDNLENIFGVFEGASEPDGNGAPEEPERDPIIEDIVSSFTVVLEFIEIVLPAEEAGAANGDQA